MDAADRAELDELRRRVFGAAGEHDPSALARLERLEQAVRDERLRAAEPSAVAPADEPPPDRASAPVRGARRPARTRRHLPTIIVAVAIAALVAAELLADVFRLQPVELSETTVPQAYAATRSRDGVELLELPVADDGSAPSLSREDEPPPFPSSGTITWSREIAVLYGWQVWIGGGDGLLQPDQCIVVARGRRAFGRCTAAALRAGGSLAAVIGYDDIDPSERPPGMRPGQSIAFWWSRDGVHVILTGSPPP